MFVNPNPLGWGSAAQYQSYQILGWNHLLAVHWQCWVTPHQPFYNPLGFTDYSIARAKVHSFICWESKKFSPRLKRLKENRHVLFSKHLLTFFQLITGAKIKDVIILSTLLETVKQRWWISKTVQSCRKFCSRQSLPSSFSDSHYQNGSWWIGILPFLYSALGNSIKFLLTFS